MKRLKNNILTIPASLAILIFLGILLHELLGTNNDIEKANPKPPQSKAANLHESPAPRLRDPTKISSSDPRSAFTNDNSSGMMLLRQVSLSNDMRIVQGNLDRAYAPLFAELKLKPDEIGVLKDLLAELKLAGETAKLQEGSFRHDQSTTETVQNLQRQSRAEITGNIADMLGAERYKIFVYYEDTLPQRAAVETIERKFSYEADPLTSEQKELLIDIFRKQALLSGQGKKSAKQPVGNPKMQSDDQYNANILKQVSPFLTESQIKSLQNHLNSNQ